MIDPLHSLLIFEVVWDRGVGDGSILFYFYFYGLSVVGRIGSEGWIGGLRGVESIGVTHYPSLPLYLL